MILMVGRIPTSWQLLVWLKLTPAMPYQAELWQAAVLRGLPTCTPTASRAWPPADSLLIRCSAVQASLQGLQGSLRNAGCQAGNKGA